MKITKTKRGFARIRFKDRYKVSCSLQESSLATEQCIWLGCDDGNPRILVSLINGGYPNGWVPLPLPDGVLPKDVIYDTRMHLTREQVAKLLPHLERFVKTGRLA